eukprot:1674526-Pyramimonas_sp.AAC.1
MVQCGLQDVQHGLQDGLKMPTLRLGEQGPTPWPNFAPPLGRIGVSERQGAAMIRRRRLPRHPL